MSQIISGTLMMQVPGGTMWHTHKTLQNGFLERRVSFGVRFEKPVKNGPWILL